MSTDDGELAPVIPLHGRRDGELLARLREALADRGAVNEELVAGDVLPTTWRTTALRDARDLQRPVRTGQVEHEDNAVTVWAQLTDWPRTPDEQAIITESMGRIADAVGRELTLLPAE